VSISDSVGEAKNNREEMLVMKRFKTQTSQFLATPSSRLSVMFLAGLLVFSALILSARSAVEVNDPAVLEKAAQTALSGQWVAEFNSREPGVIKLMFSRRSDNGDSFMTSDNISMAELQGFPSDVTSTAKTNINFRIVREAGTFNCEGYFSAGRGAGFWTLTPSQSFVSAMRSRGYDNLTDEDLLRAALHNLTTKYIEDLKSVGHDRLEFRQLLRAASHEITLNYIREMQAAGFQGLSMEQLIRARNHEIDSQYVKEVQAMGFDKQPLESLIRLRNHEITREFIAQMRTAGFDNLSIEELIRLKNHEITPEYVNGLKAEGFPEISLTTAIRLKNHEIDQDFIRRVKAKGFTNLTLDQLIKLRSNDIIK
jgi:uncharacterized protein (UPF0335 family)